MQEYKVGQILYLIGQKTTKIIPVQIVEEVVRTTIAGKEKTYTVMLPDEKQTKIDIKDIKGNLHETWQSLRTTMLSNATAAIDKMVSRAINISENVFNAVQEDELDIVETSMPVDEILPSTSDYNTNIPKIPNLNDHVQPKKNDDIIKVDLGNGMIGKMSAESLNLNK